MFSNQKTAFRCGKYHSVIFINTVEEEVYPDLGMILEYKKEINLSKETEKLLEEKAIDCFGRCAAEKELIRLRQEDLKSKMLLNKEKKGLEILSIELKEINQMKKRWLKKHKTRYDEGVKLLSPEEFEKWLLYEKTARGFPLEVY